jgi:NAD kinase
VVASPGEVASCDLVLAVGGDGTTLHALHAAAKVDRPVLGVACGSLGALTAVSAEALGHALERVAAGDPEGGPIAALEPSERFNWIAAPSSTVVQASPVHTGVTADPAAKLAQLFARLAG